MVEIIKNNVCRFDELDMWIEKGHLDEFLTLLLKEDIKLYGEEIIDSDSDSERYSIEVRAFDLDYNIPSGQYWQINNVFRGK